MTNENLPKNIAWECPLCKEEWIVAEDCEKPRCIRCKPVDPRRSHLSLVD